MASVPEEARAILPSLFKTKSVLTFSVCYMVDSGNREAAQELAGKGKEHAQLAKEARQKANQAAFDSCNMSVTNRFKVHHLLDYCRMQASQRWQMTAPNAFVQCYGGAFLIHAYQNICKPAWVRDLCLCGR